MDENRNFPASPSAGATLNALNALSPNQQRFDMEGSVKTRLFDQDQRRDSTVQERAARFDQLANSGRSQQQKSMEATLKRAMVGLEEAEKLKKKYLAEATSVKMELQLTEARMKKVSHRHEEALEYIARQKENHSHIMEVKDKDIQRWRKASTEHAMKVKKFSDKFDSSQALLKKTMADLDRERERSAASEQEAFEGRTQLAGLQGELATAIERIKVVEQERDAFKAAAKTEEVARIAAEGRMALPQAKEDDGFGSPRKTSAPLPRVEVVSSEASEEEIEQLREALESERHRADTAYDLVEYMNLECEFRCCSCRFGIKSEVSFTSEPRPIASRPVNAAPTPSPPSEMMEDIEMGGNEPIHDAMEIDATSALRTSTIFVAAEGIFRTVPSRSQPQQQPQPPKFYRTSAEQMPPPPFTNTRESTSSSQSSQSIIHATCQARQARTPSVEPPTFANNVMLPTDASILSFASAPPSAAPSPTTSEHRVADPQERQHQHQRHHQQNQQQQYLQKADFGNEFRREQQREHPQQQQTENVIFQHHLHGEADPVHLADLAKGRFGHERERREEGRGVEHELNTPFTHQIYGRDEPVRQGDAAGESERRMRPPAPPAKRSNENERPKEHHKENYRPEHNFRTISTTTRIQLKDEGDDEQPKSASAIHNSSGLAFGIPRCESTLSEPATSSTTMITTKVSREEALAMIRERRGRARSMHQADAPKEGGISRPPTRQEAPKTPRREISVGTVKSTSQRNARSVSRGRLHGL